MVKRPETGGGPTSMPLVARAKTKGAGSGNLVGLGLLVAAKNLTNA
jgi:hypothetical protein